MWYNSIIAWLLRSPLHRFVSKNMMLISYTGRKSGKSYTTPVNYLRMTDERGEFLATTSQKERLWWRNLRGGAAVRVRLQGQERPASAEAIEDETKVAENMLAYFQHAPQLARYFGIGLDESGQPLSEDVLGSARDRVFIKTRLT
ncbi:MAG: nitroreductase family deazaflavin-dependent oxidoreductase [Anaerolineales bacterium]|nr:nitroreductase family deazaflavin-dependent oxidoreductase [Anaerolineales bacterium]